MHGVAFELTDKQREWVATRAKARGISEVDAHAELLELGFVMHKKGARGERLKELDVQVLGSTTTGWAYIDANTHR